MQDGESRPLATGQFQLLCGCIMDTAQGGYDLTCAGHLSEPTFDQFKAAQLTPSQPHSVDIIRQYNVRRAHDIREATAGEPVADWSVLPELGNVILTTVGAKSGLPRTVPLGSLRFESKLAVVASVAGRQRHPAWYHNALANPQVVVETCGVRYDARAHPAEQEEWDTVWHRIIEFRPNLLDFQRMTDRQFPILIFERERVAASQPPVRSAQEGVQWTS